MVAALLRDAGLEVRIHDDHFAPDARDEVWLAEAGRRAWIVLTKDRKIRYRKNEIAAIRACGVRAFVLTSGDLQATEVGAAFLRALPAMERFMEQNPPPFVAGVSKAGRVTYLS